MKTAKLSAMFLVSLMALAGIGIGYAAWTDTIYVQGTINTGSVGWHFTAYSGTWVYKDLTTDACEIHPGSWHGDVVGATVGDHLLVARAKAYQGADDHHAIVSFDNIFPCIEFSADVTITYTGSVPGKINSYGFYDLVQNPGNYWPQPGDEVKIDQYTTLTITVYDAAGNVVPYTNLAGLQLHQGYTIHIVMTIHLPQDNTLMNLNGDFGVYAEVVQWNEFPYTPS